jgi:hypothetical protein
MLRLVLRLAEAVLGVWFRNRPALEDPGADLNRPLIQCARTLSQHHDVWHASLAVSQRLLKPVGVALTEPMMGGELPSIIREQALEQSSCQVVHSLDTLKVVDASIDRVEQRLVQQGIRTVVRPHRTSELIARGQKRITQVRVTTRHGDFQETVRDYAVVRV